MLCNYIREQKVAGRKINWHVWRCIGPCLHGEDNIQLLLGELASDDKKSCLAAALAWKASKYYDSKHMLDKYPLLVSHGHQIDWDTLQ
jgi:hypothetical protein